MSKTPKTIVSDTICFIILTNIGELDLLEKVYGEVLTTPEVVAEFEEKLPVWIKVKSPTDKYRQRIIELQIDKGEASAISLAIETADSLLILDDEKARKFAVKLGLEVTGTLGVIVKAKLRGIIPSVKPLLDKIERTNFYVSPELYLKILKEANE